MYTSKNIWYLQSQRVEAHFGSVRFSRIACSEELNYHTQKYNTSLLKITMSTEDT